MIARLKTLNLFITLVVWMMFFAQSDKLLAAGRLPPMSKKNKNEVTDLFTKEIHNLKNFEQKIEESKSLGIKQLGNKEAISNLPNSHAINNKAVELTKLDQGSAEAEGYKIKAENNEYLSKAHLNYKDPQVLRHKQDVDRIANATKELIYKLYDKLKALGIDCREKKAPKAAEPEMYIELEPLKQKEVIYDKFLCEEPRRTYNCRDSVNLKCIKTGIRYKEWEPREMMLNGSMLYHDHMNWGWSVKWKEKRHGWHINGVPGPESNLTAANINDEVRAFIASNLKVSIEQVHPVIGFPEGGRGIGNITPLYSRWRVAWDQYVFKYQYRDSYPVCEDWADTWTERCNLN